MEESDKILFHYTSLEGLLGTIESKSIWATNVLYLNDASELNYSIRLFKEQVHKIQKELIKNTLFFEDFIKNVFDREEDFFGPSGPFTPFVSSFSEENDLLSQWRGYCPKGIGISLGFKLSKLMECATIQKFLIRPCIYNEKEQIEEIEKLIKESYHKLSAEINDDLYGDLAIEILDQFEILAPTFKHPKFKEENEWRVIAEPPETCSEIKYRLVKSMVAPYIEIALPKEGDNLVINQIVVGPTHEPVLSKASVQMLLKSKNVKFDEIQYSTIPYRNW